MHHERTGYNGRFLPTPEAAETNGDHFELAAPEQQQEVRTTTGLVAACMHGGLPSLLGRV